MANIIYTAAGKKTSKKNPAILNLTIVGDNGETADLVLNYTKANGWLPAEDASTDALLLAASVLRHNQPWGNELLQKFINAHYVLKTSWNYDSALLSWMKHQAEWKFSHPMGTEIAKWVSAK